MQTVTTVTTSNTGLGMATLFFVAVFLAGLIFINDPGPNPDLISTSVPIATPIPGPTDVQDTENPGNPQDPEIYRFALLSDCGQPDYIGAFEAGSSACRPSRVWRISEFGLELIKPGLLKSSEVLHLPPAIDSNCQLLILEYDIATNARLCITAEGTIYRGTYNPQDNEPRWALLVSGDWKYMDTPQLGVMGSN